MRLRALRLENWKGVARRELAFGDGVNLIVGPNEAGKSTLAEALRHLFDKALKSSSKREEIKAVQPVGRELSPEIEVEVEAGPFRMRYLKRFLRRSATELHVLVPRAEQLAGDEAHERFHAILGEHLDEALFRALWIDQGGRLSFGSDRLPGTWLRQALDRAAGVEGPAQGEGADLLARVDQERRRYYTAAKGEETDELLRTRTADEEARDEHARLQRELADVEKQVERYAVLEREIALAKERLPELERDAERAERECDAARRRLADIAIQERGLEDLVAQVARAESEIERRGAAERRVDADGKRLADKTAELGGLHTREAKLLEARGERAAVHARAIATREREAARLHVAESDRRGFETAFELERCEERGREIDRLVARIAELRAAARPELGEELFVALRKAISERDGLRARLEVAAPRVELTALRELDVQLDDGVRHLSPEGRLDLAAPRDLRIDLPGIARLEVRVAHLEADARTRLRRVENDISERTGALGLRDPAHAEDLRASMIESNAELQLHERNLRELLAGVRATGAPEEARTALREQAEALRRCVHDWRRVRDGSVPLPESRASAAAAESEARRACEAFQQQVETEERALRVVEGQLAAAQREIDKLDGTLVALRETHTRDRAELVEERKLRSDEALRGDVAQLGARQQIAQGAIQALRVEADLVDTPMLEKLAKAARGACDRKSEQRNEAVLALAECAGELKGAGGKGVGERVEAAEALADEARRALDRVESKAKAARRLHEALVRSRDESAAAYRRPLEERLTRLGRHVFGPSFTVELDEALNLASCTRDGVRLEVARLSFGTQEQLDLLLRLAVAQSVAEQGGVPLLFDDTLGSADPERTRLIVRLLSLASETQQVFVLTCHPDRFDALGAVERIDLARETGRVEP